MTRTLSLITPGDILLEEFIKPMNITQNQLSKDICVPTNRVSQIVHGKREITADTALRLGKYFGKEPEFWLNLQVRYNMKRIFFIFYSIIILFLVSPSNVYAEVKVIVYLDKESAGWAYKISDYAFVIEKEGCSIQWNAIEEKNGERYLFVKRNCKAKFMEQIKLHRSILIEINKKWSLNSFKYILWGPFCDKGDWKWCKPIAQASLKSIDYIDYWKNYPNSKLKEINSLFVNLANSSKSYASFSKLLKEFNVNVKLVSVEKVFSQRLKKSPFLNEFEQTVLNSNPRVMYNVGMATFYIVK